VGEVNEQAVVVGREVVVEEEREDRRPRRATVVLGSLERREACRSKVFVLSPNGEACVGRDVAPEVKGR